MESLEGILDIRAQRPSVMPIAQPLPGLALALPPLFAGVEPPSGQGAYEHACAVAEDVGAGTIACRIGPRLLEFAVVLEPEEALGAAIRVMAVAMTALADAAGACAPPEKPVTIAWPDELRLDGARIGGGRLGWPAGCQPGDVPAWIVFGAMVIVSKRHAGDPGLTPDSTALDEEGFEPEEHGAIVEGFARRLMRGLDGWAEEGFGPAAEMFARRLVRAPGHGRLSVDPHGALLVADAAPRALMDALRTPSWLDPATGAPRL